MRNCLILLCIFFVIHGCKRYPVKTECEAELQETADTIAIPTYILSV